jgi:Beta-propeller repeat
MPRHRSVLISLSLVFALIGMPASKIAATDSNARFLVTLPLVFERNQGQAPAEYQFLVRREGAEVLFLADGLDVVTHGPSSNLSAVRIRWVAINPNIFASGEEVLPGQSNYFRGSDLSKWVKNVPHYGQLRYREIYPGIDLIFHGHAETVEHDYLVQPGAEPSRIVLNIDQPFQISRAGDLVIGGAGVVLQRPVAYQLVGETRRDIDVRYLRQRNGQVKLQLGPYDHAQPLIIDPVFTFSTYLAGTGTDQISAVTTDAIGNIYVTGNTNSVDFPVVNPEQPVCSSCTDFLNDPDVYVSKLDPTGHTLLYSTFIGGSKSDMGEAIVIDSQGNILVAGLSLSSDFPHAGAIQSVSCQTNQECFFLLSLTSSGSALNYSGLVGGGRRYCHKPVLQW